jgi:NAD(P)-dependent dehydrogenase (short-subunit alcohol dehydrogenase family)
MAKTVVITGANRGIGLALAKEYLGRGDNVLAICRHSSPELDDTRAEIVTGVDVRDDKCMRVLSSRLPIESIDILINNAGVLKREVLGDIDYEDILTQLEVNALGPLRVTEALLSKLKHGAKVGLITSRMGSMTDNSSGGYYGYRMSKAALNAAGVSLSHDLRDSGIAVAILHPGFVQTDMVNHAGDIPPEEAARRLAQRMDELTLETTGTFWHSNGETLPW